MHTAIKRFFLIFLFFAIHSITNCQPTIPLLEFPAKPEHDYFVLLFSGDGGWRGLDLALANNLNHENIPVVGINTKKYLWDGKTPQSIALDIEHLILTYCSKWKVSKVVLMGYSMGAEILPHSVNQLNDVFVKSIKDMILIAPDQNACFEVKLIFYAYDTNEGQPIINELKKLKVKKAYCICDDHKISLCKSGLDGIIDYTLITGGHHFDGDYDKLNKVIMKRLSSD
jgi:type IV secretory pathway VirJ component